MVRRKRRKKKQQRKALRLQILTFVIGVACAIPAVCIADDLDDVLDDLMTYRLQSKAAAERGEPVRQSENTNEKRLDSRTTKQQKSTATKSSSQNKSDKVASAK